MGLSEALIEKQSRTPAQYRRRVYLTAAIYIVLDLAAFISIVVIIWQYRLFVTLSQRSNVETLTLAIVVILFSYLLVTTFPGFLGALRLLFYSLPAGDPQVRKQAALQPAKGEQPKAYFNIAFESEEEPGKAIRLPIADEVGTLGELVLDGVEVRLEQAKDGFGNTFFEYVLNQIEHRLKLREPDFSLKIVRWSNIDDEGAAEYASLVGAFRVLAGQLQKGPIWPMRQLTAADLEFLRRQLHDIAGPVRDEALLPDLEYQAEYSIPIIPEPLGFISLKRQETRADPVVSMGCAALVAVGILALLIFFSVFPPWLPAP